jgi:hypothetical protein
MHDEMIVGSIIEYDGDDHRISGSREMRVWVLIQLDRRFVGA